MIIVDAAALVDYLLAREPAGSWVAKQLSNASSHYAPNLIDYEVASAFRRLSLAGELSARRGLGALEDLRELPVSRYPADHLLGRIWQLRRNLTAYDAAYVALAEMLGMPIVTTDRRLARSHGHSAEIVTPA